MQEKKSAKAGIPALTTAGLCSTCPLNRDKNPVCEAWWIASCELCEDDKNPARETRDAATLSFPNDVLKQPSPSLNTLFVVLCFHFDACTNICYDLHAVVCMARRINRLPLLCRTSDVSHASQSGPSLPGWITEVKTAATGEEGASAGRGCPPAFQARRMTKGDPRRIRQSLTRWMGSHLTL